MAQFSYSNVVRILFGKKSDELSFHGKVEALSVSKSTDIEGGESLKFDVGAQTRDALADLSVRMEAAQKVAFTEWKESHKSLNDLKLKSKAQ